MFGLTLSAIVSPMSRVLSAVLPAAGATEMYPAHVLRPVVILALCVAAGIGTVLLLPGRRETSLRKVGGAILLGTLLVLAGLIVRGVTGMGGEKMGVYFWIFSLIALFSAARVVTHPRPVYSALYFMLATFASAGLFILLWAEFMAAALVLIYAGAILITYVFVIMLAAQAGPVGQPVNALTDYDRLSREPVVASALGFALAGMLLFVTFDRAEGLTAPVGVLDDAERRLLLSPPWQKSVAQTGKEPAVEESRSRIVEPASMEMIDNAYRGSTQQLGLALFSNHLLNLELAGLILTISMVGAIVIARRRVEGTHAGSVEVVAAPSSPINDDPHSIPVYGTDNPRQKAYPET